MGKSEGKDFGMFEQNKVVIKVDPDRERKRSDWLEKKIEECNHHLYITNPAFSRKSMI